MYSINNLNKLLQKIHLSIQPRAIILAYHRVIEINSDPQLLSVTPQHFKDHLECLCKNYNILSLKEFSRFLREKKIPPHTVVITFDDGYVDNLLYAKPLLEQYQAPATVFVTTGYVGQKREFWYDELERHLLIQNSLPNRLELKINNQFYEWDLSKAEEKEVIKEKKTKSGSLFPDKTVSSRWDVTMKYYPSVRHKIYKELYRLFYPLNNEQQEEGLNQLATWSKTTREGRPYYRALNKEELVNLSKGNLIEIGSHTISHPVLSAQSLDVQHKEIMDSKKRLEEILNRPILSFSYPYGGSNDVGKDTIELVSKAGYEVACANFAAPVSRDSDIFWLPRYLVQDWDGKEFAYRLREFFDG